ncbi:DUF4440 domain-containing protein [Paenibacillus sp. MMS20-IR301]|uniref:nuclear transport factor 2 family protein n=1 Tax=Paenibacillus sp. MMS20-IR301 TaxID=2895946 RepID=UPI0028E6BBB4|nr:DUF4440 domain-containing protein [Paenibacillus sp. MMS20-IR301]WNS41418.1 DUF4440 domain-containing protein [Paenibacillus sp. MMS20-IR301]
MGALAILAAHICGLEEQLLSNEVRTNPAAVSLLIADDYTEFGSSGRVYKKEDQVGEGGAGEVRMTLSHFELRTLSEEAVLATYRTFNEDTGIHCLRSSIWKFRDGRWQMFFHQGTPVKGK